MKAILGIDLYEYIWNMQLLATNGCALLYSVI